MFPVCNEKAKKTALDAFLILPVRLTLRLSVRVSVLNSETKQKLRKPESMHPNLPQG